MDAPNPYQSPDTTLESVPAPRPAPTVESMVEPLLAQMNSGVNWFFWIAGLSVVNSIIFFFGGDIAFVIGLGFTQIADSIVGEVSSAFSADGNTTAALVVRIIGLVFDLFAAGMFLVFGLLGKRHHRWAVVVGMVLYTLDGLLLLPFGALLSIIFHGLALWGLMRGLSAMGQIRQLALASYARSEGTVPLSGNEPADTGPPPPA
jgi:hypothetical protein